MASSKNESPRFKAGRVVSSDLKCGFQSDEHYEEHVAELKKEYEKRQPDQIHMKQLIKMTFKQRRTWIGQQPSGKTKLILEEFPWLGDRAFVSTNYE